MEKSMTEVREFLPTDVWDFKLKKIRTHLCGNSRLCLPIGSCVPASTDGGNKLASHGSGGDGATALPGPAAVAAATAVAAGSSVTMSR